MRERPIIFDGESVRAILAGRKSQTRRVLKLHPQSGAADLGGARPERRRKYPFLRLANGGEYGGSIRHPFGLPGERLWVRETFQLEDTYEYGMAEALPPEGPTRVADEGTEWETTLIPRYRATQPDTLLVIDSTEDGEPIMRWRSPMFMPRWASRVLLEVVSVRVERLQEITDEDAIAEGIERLFTPEECAPDSGIAHVAGTDPESWSWKNYLWHGYGLSCRGDLDDQWSTCRTPVLSFASRWDTINGRKHPWTENPWVWVVEFRPVPPEARTE